MPAPGSGLEDFAKKWAQGDMWDMGQPVWRQLTTYINYAANHESLKSMYGHELWWLERLHALKAIL